MTENKLLRMDNVGIVVESLENAISFFEEIGLILEGRATVEGEWAGRVTGLGSQCVEIAMMVTPDGHSRLELSRFINPPTISDHRSAPVNALGYLRVMFTVEDIDDMVSRLQKYGAQLVGEVVQYENSYRLCYIRNAEGLLIGLAQELHNKDEELQTIYEAVGGQEGLLQLAEAWHARVLEDEVVSHAFSHGYHPEHTERLAAYWAEALGGPQTYTQEYGNETNVVRLHSGNGPHHDMDIRAIACFDQALVDVGLDADDKVRKALHDYFAWTTKNTMAKYPGSANDVPEGLEIPHWSWDGLVSH